MGLFDPSIKILTCGLVFSLGLNGTFPGFDTDPLQRRLRSGLLLRHPQVFVDSRESLAP